MPTETNPLPARRSRTVLRALHFASSVGWMRADRDALREAQRKLDRLVASGAATPREVELALRNYDWMRDESKYPVEPRDLERGAAFLAILAAYSEGGPEAVKALGY